MKPFRHKILAIMLAIFTLGVQSGFSYSVMGCLHQLESSHESETCCQIAESTEHCMMLEPSKERPCCIQELVIIQYDFLSAGIPEDVEKFVNGVVLQLPVAIDLLPRILQKDCSKARNYSLTKSKRIVDVQLDLQVFRI